VEGNPGGSAEAIVNLSERAAKIWGMATPEIPKEKPPLPHEVTVSLSRGPTTKEALHPPPNAPPDLTNRSTVPLPTIRTDQFLTFFL
jgi:hypothetical protein